MWIKLELVTPTQPAMDSKSMAERFAAVREQKEGQKHRAKRMESLGLENTVFENGKYKNKTFLSVYYEDQDYVKWTIDHKTNTGNTENWEKWYEFIEQKVSAYEGKPSRASSSETTDERLERLESSVDRLERSVEDLQTLVQDLCKIIQAPANT